MPALFTVNVHCSVGPGSGITSLGRDEEQPMFFSVLFFLCAEMRRSVLWLLVKCSWRLRRCFAVCCG